MSLLDEILAKSNATVEVETTLLPKMTFNMDELAAGEPSLVTKFLKPRLTVRAAGLTHKVEPAGPPESSPPWGILLVLSAAALGVVAWRALR